MILSQRELEQVIESSTPETLEDAIAHAFLIHGSDCNRIADYIRKDFLSQKFLASILNVPGLPEDLREKLSPGVEAIFKTCLENEIKKLFKKI